jgi:excinuclease UvrABC nuclease subunit
MHDTMRTMLKTTLGFSKEHFTSPCCYIYRDAQGKALYVGLARKGFDRVFNSQKQGGAPGSFTSHETAYYLAARIQVFIYDTVEDAKAQERQLIQDLRPQYNWRTGITFSTVKF